MKKTLKLFISFLMATVIVTTINLSVFAYGLYQEKESQIVTDGVVYEKSLVLCSAGWLDVYALIIDIKNPNVKLDVLESTGEYALKETVETFVKQNGAVAAVNGDFFASGNPTSSMGEVIKDGEIDSARNFYNASEFRYAGLFVDTNDDPFIDYLKIINIAFFTSSAANIQLESKNKVTDMKKPIYYDTNASKTTADLDKRFKNLYKIVVEDGYIIQISEAGQTVYIPDNGYAIILDEATAKEHLSKYKVGEKAEYTETYTFRDHPNKNMGTVVLGISGGSKILDNGSEVGNGLVIDKDSRSPRTIVGVNKEKTRIMIIAIDGRGKSIGVTHSECAQILRDYGASDGFHLDGGGSTTMVTREQGSNNLQVVNTPSDGSQRKVANALGVYTTQKTGPLSGMFISVDEKDTDINIIATRRAAITVKGHDENKNPVAVGSLTYSHSGVEGRWEGNNFYASEEGTAQITVSSGNVSSTIEVNVLSKPIAIKLDPLEISLSVGGKTQFVPKLVNEDGYGVQISPGAAKWSINPQIGYFDEYGTFNATMNGNAIITCNYEGLVGMASVAIGTSSKVVSNFENSEVVTYASYPGAPYGKIEYSDQAYHSGSKSIAMSYTPTPNTTGNQGANFVFSQNPSFVFEGKPTGIGFWVKGDSTGYSLRARMKDSAGAVIDIDFDTKLNFQDWRYVKADLPIEISAVNEHGVSVIDEETMNKINSGAKSSSISYPVRLEHIYVLAQNTTTTKQTTVYIDDISAIYGVYPDNSVSKMGGFVDAMQKQITGVPSENETEITVFGPTANRTKLLDTVALNAAINLMNINSSATIFAGYTDLSGISSKLSVPSVTWMDRFEANGVNNVKILSLATSKGGLRQTDASQWQKIENELYNSGKKNTVIVMNKDIWSDDNGFDDARERNMLHNLIKKYVQTTGSNVIVVAGCSNYTKVNVVDGVRYITLNGVNTRSTDIFESYNVLRIRADANTMSYDIQSVYER